MELKNLNDYLPLIQEKFPELSSKDIKRICLFGFKSLYLHNIYGGDVNIRDNDFWMYIGNMTLNSKVRFKQYIEKLAIKLRVLHKRKKLPWDGYYYFAISDKLQDLINNLKCKKGRKRKIFNYGKVYLYKLLDECSIRNSNKKFIYRIPYISDIGYKINIPELISDKAELIITRNPLTFNDILISNNNYGG